MTTKIKPSDEPTEGTGLWAKLLSVRKQVTRVPRNGHNSFHNYDYATESDLIDNVRPLLDEAGLLLMIDCPEPPVDVAIQTRKGATTFITTVKIVFTWFDVATGESWRSVFWGRGEDPADKGPYKAYTGGVKYFLMKTLQIPTGDDPELENGEGSAVEERERADNRQPTRTEPARGRPTQESAGRREAPTQSMDAEDITEIRGDIKTLVRMFRKHDPSAADLRIMEIAHDLADNPDTSTQFLLEAEERMRALGKRLLAPAVVTP